MVAFGLGLLRSLWGTQMAQITQMVSPDGENHVTQKSRKTQKRRPSALRSFAALGHTDGTDDTDYACLAARDACGLSL